MAEVLHIREGIYDGDTTELDLTSAFEIEEARVRWGGWRTSYYAYDSNVEIKDETAFDDFYEDTGDFVKEAHYPPIPDGYNHYRSRYNAEITLRNDAVLEGDDISFEVAFVRLYDTEATGIDRRRQGDRELTGIITLEKDETITLSDSLPSTLDDWTGEPARLVVSILDNEQAEKLTIVESEIELTTIGRDLRYKQTRDPKVEINNEITSHSGDVFQGENTQWYNISGLDVGEINIATHSVSWSERAIVEFEIIYKTFSPNLLLPENATRTDNRKPEFEFEFRDDPNNPLENNHARIQFSKFSGISPVLYEYKSHENQTNWEYYDEVNEVWLDYPEDGVPAGTRVKFKFPENLPYGLVYWTVSTWYGDNNYSVSATPYSLRISLRVEGSYALTINDINYNVYTLQVSETNNGEIGYINFEINNQDGPNMENVGYRDTVLLSIIDELGNQKDYTGIVKSKNPTGEYLELECILGDGILSERIITEDYPKQDIGETVAHIVENYCSPITKTNVDTNTGFQKAIPADGQKPLKILEDLRRQYGMFYFVDVNYDLHFFAEEDIGESFITARYGD